MPYPDPLETYIECKNCKRVIEINEHVEKCPYCGELIETRIDPEIEERNQT